MTKSRSKEDRDFEKELTVIKTLALALLTLDEEGRFRVMKWLQHYFDADF
jgi:hypothetical protein